MDASRALALILAVFALVTVRAHNPSHDNILRIQLWDAEGLSREPLSTKPPTTTTRGTSHHKFRVDLNSLYNAMLEDAHGGGYGRFTRHKVRHKRRRPRQTGTDLPWRFHSGAELMNVAVYDDDTPWNMIENDSGPVNASAVSDSSAGEVNLRDVSPPMTLRQPQDEVMSEGKHCSVI
ncbi:Uncharacterized protein OBRU01_17428 [Operophtera brumata]|uniref:Uncharacterized protein n=1 Tax=Operophtera brumata TaxID=104452 RepID=A0A0L7L122_OPEBR|nr:Uncharacterized protein OBRU01_17428 [Operophtera brumata]